jgi:hypothetical protein
VDVGNRAREVVEFFGREARKQGNLPELVDGQHGRASVSEGGADGDLNHSAVFPSDTFRQPSPRHDEVGAAEGGCNLVGSLSEKDAFPEGKSRPDVELETLHHFTRRASRFGPDVRRCGCVAGS